MSSSRPRKSFGNAFEGLNISRSRSRSPSKMSLIGTVRGSIMRGGFPNWRTLCGPRPTERCDFTLRMDDKYREHFEDGGNQVVFDRSSVIINEIKEMLGGEGKDDDTTRAKLLEVYGDFTAETMSHLIFGSNMQERAGMSLDSTLNLCQAIFAGQTIDPEDIDERSAEYQAEIVRLRKEKIVDHPEARHVIRSRREVIQHAQALLFLTDIALNRDEPLTESLILETHRILCHGLPIPGTDEQGSWAGRYRDNMVWAGGSQFCKPGDIPGHMARFIKDFNDDVRQSEASRNIDPFFLAADICQDFVMIHPFKDGNGRMCRLLASAYLIKYAGVVVSIGEHDHDRKEYLEIVQLASDPGQDGENEDEAKGLLASFFLSKAGETLRKLRHRLREAKA